MDSRRQFLKKAAMLSGSAALANVFPPSVARAFGIDPAPGTTWKDAEHVVILMQENRSFDHAYGSLRGVRGFNDPRAFTMPNKDSVWLQRDLKGETYVPFRLNLKDTKATWMGSLPHSWTDQTDARNNGACDKWLQAKQPGHKEYKHMPLTLGYYNREDLPFYYSFADAFTICDQNFCSSLTGTTPNRLYLWTGKTRHDDQTVPCVRNEEADYNTEVSWKTFPERLEENNISWKIYQNEIGIDVGFEGEESAWLSNFGDNPLEYFKQYHVRFLPAHMQHYSKVLSENTERLGLEVEELQEKIKTESEGDVLEQLKKKLVSSKRELEESLRYLQQYTPENYSRLSAFEKRIHEKAFSNNISDPDYHKLETLKYTDNGTEREMKVPKGDVFHQFRHDVKNGKLPAVSWLVAPENFSDHPGAPWYGAWYLSEAVDILTENPEVWKKTIFILCYDENDGYFDHVPPFVPPVPNQSTSGKVSKGIDLDVEYVSLEEDQKRNPSNARGGPIGLGYRVPLVIASPWSRGGAVCSQVFDHTSILMFLEKFLSHKTGKEIKETNITAWRRTICGDLTSTFTPYNGEKYVLPEFIVHNEFVESIHKAQFKQLPSGFRALAQNEIDAANRTPVSSVLPRQEKGTRPSRALPYELYVDGNLTADKSYEMRFEAGKNSLGASASGAPFQVYSYGGVFINRNYAVVAGDILTDNYAVENFNDDFYHFKVHGPNGFFREFKGSIKDTPVDVICAYEKIKKKPSGNLELTIVNRGSESLAVSIIDNSYHQPSKTKKIAPGEKVIVKINLSNSSGWYDTSVKVGGNKIFENRFAGRVENGREGISDPAMA